MNKIDWLISRRILIHIVAVIAVFFGLIALSESLDTWRFESLTETQGRYAAVMAIVGNAASWSIKVLPVTVLIGSITALVSLQASRELLVIKAGGASIWRIIRGPVLAMLVLSAIVASLVDAQVTILNRGIMPTPYSNSATIGNDNQIWLEQTSVKDGFVIQAERILADKATLINPTFFMGPDFDIRRIVAKSAKLTDREWQISEATLFFSNQPSQTRNTLALSTDSLTSDLALKLTSMQDFTFFELATALASEGSDPRVRAAAATRYAKLMSMPVLLVGILLIAFAFTSGYRRSHSYGRAIIYGILMGFLVFVINEMSDRAGSAGVMAPTLAAWGPAILAIFAGITLLLFREDGQA